MSNLLLLGEHLGDGCFGCPVEELQEFSTKLRCCGFAMVLRPLCPARGAPLGAMLLMVMGNSYC